MQDSLVQTAMVQKVPEVVPIAIMMRSIHHTVYRIKPITLQIEEGIDIS